MVVNHKNLIGANVHVISAYTYANTAARTGATGFVAADLGKVAWQQDDDTLWLLTGTGPVWVQINSSAGNLSVTDDGTFINFIVSGTTYFKIRKADGNMLVAGGYDTDQSL